MKPASLKVYVINLDRSTQRLVAVSERLSRLGWSFERVAAVDGQTLDVQRMPEVDIAAFEAAQGRRLLPADAGCYLSHIECLRRLLASDQPHALVLEDDALPADDFPIVVDALLRVADQWDIVKLSAYHSGSPCIVRRLTDARSLGIPFSRHCNTAAVLFNRSAAQRLLQTLLPMTLPYDHALERPWLHGMRLHIVTPAPSLAGTDQATTIELQPKHKFRGLRRIQTHLFRLRTELMRVIWALGLSFRQRRR